MKKVGDYIGGRILDLPSFKILDQGRAEGEQERKALESEIERLQKEIEQLKAIKK